MRGRGGGIRSVRQGQVQVSIKSRLGVTGKPAVTDGGRGGGGGGGIKSRLGIRGGGGSGSSRKSLSAAGIGNTPITDARQKINLNRVITGRIGDAREKIEIKRSKRLLFQQQRQLIEAAGIMRNNIGSVRGRRVAGGFTPIKTLKITTPVSPVGSTGLFRNAVSGMGGWSYASPQKTFSPSPYSTSTVLTRTIRNPQAKYEPPSTVFATSSSSYSRSSMGGGMYSSPGKSTMSKIPPNVNRRGMGESLRNEHYEIDSENDDEDMDIEDSVPVAMSNKPRTSIKSRLDTPSKYKVQVSNLQSSVTTDDIMELFADVGELVSARVFGGGQAEAYYRTKADCLKAIEAYHNRLLDGSPMKVILSEDGQGTLSPRTIPASTRPSGIISGLKSAGGATMKIPKSTANRGIKIHPDISAIHKVLFQPSSSSNSTKMLFNKGN